MHDHGDDLLSSIFSISGALAHKFDSLFAGHQGTPVTTKQQPHSAQHTDLDNLKVRLDTSEALTR